MAKIVIPPVFIDTRSNALSIPSTFFESIKRKPIDSFSKSENIYILNLKPRSKEINNYASGCLGYLNINGELEINSTANLALKLKHWPFNKLFEGDLYFDPRINKWENYRTSGDDWKFKKLTINVGQANGFIDFNYTGSTSYFNRDDENNETRYENTTLKEVNINAHTINLHLIDCHSIEKIKLGCEEVQAVRINGRNIQEISMPNIKKMYCANTFISQNLEESFPKDPILKINPNCILKFNLHWRSGFNDKNIDLNVAETITDILTKEKKEYQIKNNLLEIKISDLQRILFNYENHLLQNGLKKLEENNIKKDKKEKENIKQK